ncbi:TSUP family transporter [uncultured Aliiroseovarius sp.]|uniref:TSUP family transporter n=1 Tax=uncultured Aliiroseovarius sp. TaxID=1658783 RepID=UPI002624EF10|nr:TSUP family transporter [uncultured Aliiroseovarius sp.]
MFDLTTEVVLLLLGAAFVAGFVDSIAGGGGLITLPALLLAGVPPVTALATNKVQGLFGAGMAAVTYARAGHVNLRRQIRAAALSFAGAVIGAFLASSLPTDVIRLALPVLLIAVAVFFAVKPGLGDIDKHERITPFLFTVTFVPLIGFYDGLLGPGTGAFFMIGFVSLAGYGILRATAHTKLLNFASNVGGLVGFMLVAPPLWALGLAMGVAQMAGAYLGSTLASRIGAKLIKPVLVIASSALALKLLSEWF